jgi:uncharacterized protein
MEQLSSDTILAYLRANREFLEREYGGTKIALFGSFACNEAREDSDIDLLIEATLKCFKNRFYLREHLEKQFQRKVDVGYFDNVRSLIYKNLEKDLKYAYPQEDER